MKQENLIKTISQSALQSLLLVAALIFLSNCSDAKFNTIEDTVAKPGASNDVSGQGANGDDHLTGKDEGQTGKDEGKKGSSIVDLGDFFDFDLGNNSGGNNGGGFPPIQFPTDIGSNNNPPNGNNENPPSNNNEDDSNSDDPFVSVDDEIGDNAACQQLFDNESTSSVRRDFTFNGFGGAVIVNDGARVIINGRTENVSVNRADDVTINGRHKDICVFAKKVNTINGSTGGGSDIVVAAEGASGTVTAINGHSSSTIVVINMDVSVINGSFKRLVVDGGSVGTINGRVSDVHLLNGAYVNRTNGQIGDIVYH